MTTDREWLEERIAEVTDLLSLQKSLTPVDPLWAPQKPENFDDPAGVRVEVRMWMKDRTEVTIQGYLDEMTLDARDYIDVTTFGDIRKTYLVQAPTFKLRGRRQAWSVEEKPE